MKKHRPPSRLKRDHFKRWQKFVTQLRRHGHQVAGGRYWYGHTTAYCVTCRGYHRLVLGEKTLRFLPNPIVSE